MKPFFKTLPRAERPLVAETMYCVRDFPGFLSWMFRKGNEIILLFKLHVQPTLPATESDGFRASVSLPYRLGSIETFYNGSNDV